MRYFGRRDFREGGTYPVGLHWGHIYNFSGFEVDALEYYIVLRVPTPLHMVKHHLGANCYWIHEWTLLAFAAWPCQNFPSRFRYRWTHFWSPVYGS